LAGPRDLDVPAIAGHDPLCVALYGRRTGILVATTLYPGLLYVHEVPAFGRGIQRLVDLRQDELVAHILDHIEESKDALVGLSDWNKPAAFGMLFATSPSGPLPADRISVRLN
jgi:hypothetical protein